MGIQSNKRIIGILANVDSGKTTLAEAMLFHAGAIRKLGRVDHGNAFLDTGVMERARGITIFSKLARLDVPEGELILLDTPGHADFTPETERALAVLDYCILVINGADGVSAQTRRLWNLLKLYQVPVILFVNKLDQEGVNPGKVYEKLRKDLSEQIIDFTEENLLQSEALAILSEDLLELFLDHGTVGVEAVRGSIRQRRVFPCYFGSALKDQGVEELLHDVIHWTQPPLYPDAFSAKIYKITREGNQRLTYMKITGGILKNKSLIGDEKINEIRLYSGLGYESVQSVSAGEICAVTGLKNTRAGQIIGHGEGTEPAVFPVLSYRVNLDEGGDQAQLIRLLQQIGEELPDLDVSYDKETSSVYVHIMGDILLEVLEDLVMERGEMKISMDEGSILYKETLTSAVIGIGHFEPLRHYAEVHLLIEPSQEPGIIFESSCSDSSLSPTRQQQILRDLNHLNPPGVLMGAGLSHLKVTLINGREHEMHTQGGDFREAAARALRQGLMTARAQGNCRLLEPVYDFEILTDTDMVGRIMTDLDRLGAGRIQAQPAGDQMVVTGSGPVRTMRSYQGDILSVTRGQAKLRFDFGGYLPCSDESQILRSNSYDPEKDLLYPTGSIFCAQGAGYFVAWNQVGKSAHIPVEKMPSIQTSTPSRSKASTQNSIAPDEIDRILQQTFYANANEKKQWGKKRVEKSCLRDRKSSGGVFRNQNGGPPYLLVDGYNVIHAWPELAELAEVNFEAAREKLIDLLHDYQGYTAEQVIVVFDAWKVTGGRGSREERDQLLVVFTRENETADGYIERRAMELAKNHPVKVVTSDAAEQRLTSGSGALVYSAGRFREVISEIGARIWQEYQRSADPNLPNRPMADLGKLTADKFEKTAGDDTFDHSGGENKPTR